MEFWPADFRADNTDATTKKRRKGKEVYVNESGLELGSLGAVTLTSSGRRRFEWINLVQPRSKNLPQAVGKSLEVFPSTKPPLVNVPRLTIHQRAEQGARFLRTYHPDVDIPFELIKDELESDEEETAADSALNPYAGSRLTYFSLNVKRKARTSFLAFACGETGADLNISPFRVTRDQGVLFSPSAVPVLSFNTPIQQIISLPPKSEASQKFSLLGVRTHSSVSVLKLQGAAGAETDVPSIAATTVAAISPSETGNRRVVDMSCNFFSSSDAQMLLVNDVGAVYNCRVEGEKKTVAVVSNVPEVIESEGDQFWRIIRRDSNAGLRSSGKRVHLFDLRARTGPSVELFHLKEAGEYMTSIEDSLEGHHTMCFSTTSKLVWFDIRNFKSPVFLLKHQRAFDRSLRAETVQFGASALATLSSTTNRLVTVYDVNYGYSGHIHLYGEPSILSGSPGLDLPLAGSLFFRHPTEEGPELSLFQLSSRGSLWKTNIGFFDKPAQDSVPSTETLEWTEEVRTLAQKTKTMSPDIGNMGGREFFDANLRRAYEKIFQVQPDTDGTPEEDAEAVYQTLEKMPFFWQDMDSPAEHMLTTFDVAFQSGLEPLHASRADFLTESLLSSPRGFAALTRERMPISRLISTVRWHHDLSSMPSRMVPDISTRSQPLVDQLRGEAMGHATTAEGMRRTTEGAQHLALDLALSRHVYAPTSFSKARADVAGNELEDSNLLLQATKAMSLGATEPPPVHFGFLRPTNGVPRDDEESMESADGAPDVGPHMPLGVRLLVSQWEVGTDPGKYVYRDPYDEDATPASQKPVSGRRANPADGKASQYPTQQSLIPAVLSVPRPPLVVTTSRPAPAGQERLPTRTSSILGPLPGTASQQMSVRKTGVTVYSQGASQPLSHTLSSQEQLGPSTQPLPGPFGGGSRQLNNTKKKAGKKRMGGF